MPFQRLVHIAVNMMVCFLLSSVFTIEDVAFTAGLSIIAGTPRTSPILQKHNSEIFLVSGA
jgi:hypothetical protein